MANFSDAFKIASGLRRSSKFPVGCQHVTTSNFMDFGVAYIRELSPHSKLDLNVGAFARAIRMKVPTYGRARMNIRAFFVPHRLACPYFNEFLTDTTFITPSATHFVPTILPQISYINLVACVIMDATVVLPSDPGSAYYDVYTNVTNSGTVGSSYTRYNLGPIGKRILKFLNQLGYKPQFSIELDPSNQPIDVLKSAMPFLDICKVYSDWFFPNVYSGLDNWQNVFEGFVKSCASSNGNILPLNDTWTLLQGIIKVCYDADFFTSCFDTPVGPQSGVRSAIDIVDTTNSAARKMVATSTTHGSGVGAGSGTPSLVRLASGSYSAETSNLTQFAIDALKRLTDFMTRNRLAGARPLDRYLARYGVQLDAAKLQRSVYLGSHEVPLLVGDIYSTSDTVGAGLGDFAGRAKVEGKPANFTFESDEFGFFFLTYSVVPQIGYYQGDDPHVDHKTKLSLYQPEFDALGNTAVPVSWLYSPMRPRLGGYEGYFDTFKGISQSVFGFAPQYSDWKISKDKVTGDYNLMSLSNAGSTSEAWHLMRNVEEMGYQLSDFVHSLNFLRSHQNGDQFLRIFANMSPSVDHFDIHFLFDGTLYAPYKKLYDTYEFDEGGKDVVVHSQGVKMN